MRTEPIGKWVRAYVDEVAVVDSREPLMFWEDSFPVPAYAFPPRDVRTHLLAETLSDPPREPAFFLPKGPVSRWYDLVVGERRIPHAAWVREAPELSDLLVLSWQPGVLDRWLEEEEPVAGHPRDPYKRVEAIASSRHVAVELDGVRLADSHRPVLLFETYLPTRYSSLARTSTPTPWNRRAARACVRTRVLPTSTGTWPGTPTPPTWRGRTPRPCPRSARWQV